MSSNLGSFNLQEAQQRWKQRKKLYRHHQTLFILGIILAFLTLGIFSYSLSRARAGTVNLSLAISRAYICGDGILDIGEECDDGNRVSSDGCSSDCKTENAGGSNSGGSTSGGDSKKTIIPLPPLPRVIPPDLGPIPPAQTATTTLVIELFSTATGRADATFTKSNTADNLPIIVSSRPIFRGKVSVPNALIRLVLRSDIIATVIQADAQGNWQWQPSQNLADGAHELLITVYDPTGSQVLIAEVTIKFLLDPTNSGRYKEPLQNIITKLKPNEQKNQQLLQDNLGFGPPLTYYSLNDYVPFDLRVSAPKNIKTGEDLQLRLILNQYRSEIAPNKLFTYTLRDQSGQVIWQQTETHSIQNQTNILTNLRPEIKINPGVYQLEVSVPEGNTTVVASTYLQIIAPLSPLLQTLEINWLMVAQTTAALLILFLLAIFFEYRYLRGVGRLDHPITEKDLQSIGYLT
ncbi:MAG: Ig-like domain-containing protein [Candidatus Komeilibacteria bacterium]